MLTVGLAPGAVGVLLLVGDDLGQRRGGLLVDLDAGACGVVGSTVIRTIVSAA